MSARRRHVSAYTLAHVKAPSQQTPCWFHHHQSVRLARGAEICVLFVSPHKVHFNSSSVCSSLFFLSLSFSLSAETQSQAAQSSFCSSTNFELQFSAATGQVGDLCPSSKSAKQVHLSYSAYLDSLRNKYKLNKKEPSNRLQQFNKSASFYLSSQNSSTSAASSRSLRRRHRTDLTAQPEASDLLVSSNRAHQAATYTSTTSRLFPKSNSLFVPYKALDSFTERLVRQRSLANTRDVATGKLTTEVSHLKREET